MIRSSLVCIAIFVAMLCGCATPTPMAFEKENDKLSEQSPPVLLMTATIRNTYRTSFQPKVIVLHVEKPDAKDKADRLNFKMDDKSKMETGSPVEGNTYLMRLPLEKGTYHIKGMSSHAASFPINGFYFAPLHSSVQVSEPGVFYLGHVEATIRERQGSEFKAGPSVPLIDQAIAGASGGTFDIEISDRLAKDEAMFKTRFPALQNVDIKKAILPPFDRQAAQKWWEQN